MSDRATPSGSQHVASAVLVIPFSELGTKSEASRAKMMDQLLTNIKHVLKNVFHVPWVKYRVFGERLVFLFKKEDVHAAIDALQHVPGILRLHACVETQPRPETITNKVAELVQRGAMAPDRSALEIRALFFDDKKQKETLLDGVVAALREKALPRDGQEKSSPCTYIEMHPAFAYISLEYRDGLNGNPVGTQNPVVAEIVGRAGDLLASLLAIKRGIVLTPAFLSIGEFAIDPARYEAMLSGIKRGIDAFHGFPVKRYFFLSLGRVLSMLRERKKTLMDGHPCTCCIVARRAMMHDIITRNSMTNFAIQGTAPLPPGPEVDSCPFGASIDPATNPDGLFLVNPLLTTLQELPPLFASVIETLPEPAQKSKGYTWSFCRLRAQDQPGGRARGIVQEIQAFVKQLMRDRPADFVTTVGENLPFRE
ncbi:MAG: hypothetical protein Q6373_009900 [Candidatus Sigynarchaeota archaeon]